MSAVSSPARTRIVAVLCFMRRSYGAYRIGTNTVQHPWDECRRITGSSEDIMKPVAILFCASTLAAQTKPPAYYNPTRSPDGRTIAFESTRDGGSSVYIV